MAGRIKKATQKENFTVIPNAPLRDKNMSWKAKGLLVYLLSMNDDWEVFKSDLSKRSKDGYDSTDSAFKELEKHGYIVNEGSNRNDAGLFSGNDYLVFSEPQILSTDRENPGRYRRGLSDTVNPQLRNTIIPYSNNSLTLKKKHVFTPPDLASVITYFTENGYSEDSARRAFDYYQEGKWKDSRGKQVKNWKQKMRGVWFRDENRAQEKTINNPITQKQKNELDKYFVGQ